MNKALGVASIVLFLLCSCTSTGNEPSIHVSNTDHPIETMDSNCEAQDELLNYNDEKPFLAPDLRGHNLSELNLSGCLDYLLLSDFNDRTIWPEKDKMPDEFDLQQIMEYGKNPGLGVRELHNSGFTGKGVGIAIIDQPIRVDHIEYASQLQFYEKLDDVTWQTNSMHGPAVASIAVGKTVGVAPDADLYFIATFKKYGEDYSYIAKAINRILEVNQQLPEDNKIRVISMSLGWKNDVLGYDELMAAIEDAMSEGILVISSNLEFYSPFNFHGLGRSPLDDPDDFSIYKMAKVRGVDRYPDVPTTDRLLAPMDARATAGMTGIDKYVFYSIGGRSWAMPYLAGVYALAVQADPSITPEQFWDIAMRTGRHIVIEHEGESYDFGPIIDPQAIIGELIEQ